MYDTPEEEAVGIELQAAIEKMASVSECLEQGEFIESWVVVGVAYNPDQPGHANYFQLFSGGEQPRHITSGLFHEAQRANDNEE